jgi:N-acetylglucosamine kinase-like BadF-type ATPase
MKYYVGIEGIGTRYCVAVLADSGGNILSSERLFEPLSLHTTPRPLLQFRLLMLLQFMLSKAGLGLAALAESTVCIGLSGVTFEHNAVVDVPAIFRGMAIKTGALICTGDADIIFASHAFSDSGTALTCSMGSMATAITPEHIYRVGGWGPTLGDEGSGYWMGRAALRAIGYEAEAKLPRSVLWREIKSFLENPLNPIPEWEKHSISWRQECDKYHKDEDERTAIFLFAHQISLENAMEWRSIASSLVVPLMDAWRAGDKAASRIVRKAAVALASQFKQVCDLAHVAYDFGPLVLYGGVFTHNKDFQAEVERRIEAACGKDIQIIPPADKNTLRATCGALLLALGGSETLKLKLPPQHVIDHLKAQPTANSGALTND